MLALACLIRSLHSTSHLRNVSGVPVLKTTCSFLILFDVSLVFRGFTDLFSGFLRRVGVEGFYGLPWGF